MVILHSELLPTLQEHFGHPQSLPNKFAAFNPRTGSVPGPKPGTLTFPPAESVQT